MIFYQLELRQESHLNSIITIDLPQNCKVLWEMLFGSTESFFFFFFLTKSSYNMGKVFISFFLTRVL